MGLIHVTSPGGLLQLIVVITAVISVNGGHWSYGHEDQWPQKCIIGRQQSPVNLQIHNADKRHFNLLQFSNYQQEYESTLSNNGHSVMLKLIKPEQKPRVKGGGLPHEYVLDHLHFHWGSEHTIHSNRYPLELHMVHYAQKYNSTTEAVQSTSQQALAVIGVLFDLNVHSTKGINKGFTEALKQVEKIPNKEVAITSRVSPSDFLPTDITGFYRYEGSLTTPSCDESVVWTVFTDHGHLTEDQLQEFHSVHSEIGPLSENFRALQDLNGRIITYRESNALSKGNKFNVLWNLIIFLLFFLYTQLTVF